MRINGVFSEGNLLNKEILSQQILVTSGGDKVFNWRKVLAYQGCYNQSPGKFAHSSPAHLLNKRATLGIYR